MGSNTTTVNGRVIEIVPSSTFDEDWNIDNDLGWGGPIRVHSIIFKPTGANDVMIILNTQDGTTTAPEIVQWKVGGDTEEQVFYGYGQPMFPAIDADTCTLNTAQNARILIHFVQGEIR